MKRFYWPFLFGILCLGLSFIWAPTSKKSLSDTDVVSYVVDLQKEDLKFYWRDNAKQNFRNAGRLKAALQKQGKELVFAMNGGMYLKDGSPQGLYIENGKTLKKVNTTQTAYGNFYMQPNGIFYLTKSKQGVVCKTSRFKPNPDILFATQSGPMLLIDGKLHPKFRDGSKNVHIRNGVGVLPDGKLLFAMSKERVNFFDFATYFKTKGCKQALYLDGFVSRTYHPKQKWTQLDGNFGVIIGVTK